MGAGAGSEFMRNMMELKSDSSVVEVGTGSDAMGSLVAVASFLAESSASIDSTIVKVPMERGS